MFCYRWSNWRRENESVDRLEKIRFISNERVAQETLLLRIQKKQNSSSQFAENLTKNDRCFVWRLTQIYWRTCFSFSNRRNSFHSNVYPSIEKFFTDLFLSSETSSRMCKGQNEFQLRRSSSNFVCSSMIRFSFWMSVFQIEDERKEKRRGNKWRQKRTLPDFVDGRKSEEWFVFTQITISKRNPINVHRLVTKRLKTKKLFQWGETLERATTEKSFFTRCFDLGLFSESNDFDRLSSVGQRSIFEQKFIVRLSETETRRTSKAERRDSRSKIRFPLKSFSSREKSFAQAEVEKEKSVMKIFSLKDRSWMMKFSARNIWVVSRKALCSDDDRCQSSCHPAKPLVFGEGVSPDRWFGDWRSITLSRANRTMTEVEQEKPEWTNSQICRGEKRTSVLLLDRKIESRTSLSIFC